MNTSYIHRDDPVLVLAIPNWAFFSIHSPDDPTMDGDEWDRPYSPDCGHPGWPGGIIRVAWLHPALLPHQHPVGDYPGDVVPTPLEINRNRLPWLRLAPSPLTQVVAGTPLSEFKRLLGRLGRPYGVYERDQSVSI